MNATTYHNASQQTVLVDLGTLRNPDTWKVIVMDEITRRTLLADACLMQDEKVSDLVRCQVDTFAI